MRRAYLLILGLTAINPMTVTYFVALILGLPALTEDPGSRVVFATSAFVASLAWQSLIAGVGAVVHHTASTRIRTLTSILGSLIILALRRADPHRPRPVIAIHHSHRRSHRPWPPPRPPPTS